jgi:hypothetical protein
MRPPYSTLTPTHIYTKFQQVCKFTRVKLENYRLVKFSVPHRTDLYF